MSFSEPSTPFPFDEVADRVDNVAALPSSAAAHVGENAALALLSALLPHPAEIRNARKLQQRLAVIAFRALYFSDLTQQQLGKWLGYPKHSAAQCFNTLLRRHERKERLAPRGPGRKAKPARHG
ncbi:MAG: hypothetical protein ACR2NX_00350 [Chthoniobacterales bacterium]